MILVTVSFENSKKLAFFQQRNNLKKELLFNDVSFFCIFTH